MFAKFGESLEIGPENVQGIETVIPVLDPQKLEEFSKFAENLKKIAPKANDFLYFSAAMLHAAEASTINEDGTQKLDRFGKTITASWDKSNGSWKWVCSDKAIKPYKNANGDIFPEEELVKAYKKWIGKPLCIDHKSSSVDHVRGFIVDTYYDRNLKRVIGLCALDKFNYPDLARKVATGYQTAVSMGTAVGRAICSDCGNVARVESDFCTHMRNKSCYGEINIDLNPIELSIVVNGADPKAHIKHIIAAANTLNAYVETKQEQLKRLADNQFTARLARDDGSGNATSFDIQANDLGQFRQDINSAFEKLEEINTSMQKDTNEAAYNQSSGTLAMPESEFPGTDQTLAPPSQRFLAAETNNELKQELMQVKASIERRLVEMQKDLDKLATINKEDTMSGSKDMQKQSYFQGGGGLNEPTPGERRYEVDPLNEHLRDKEDKQMVGQKPFPGVGDVEGLYPNSHHEGKSDMELKKMLARAEAEERAMRRTAVIQKVKDALEETKKEGYFLGGGGLNEPTPGKRRYEIDPLNEHLRNKEDKQMVGQKPFPDIGDVEGLHPSPDSAEPSDELARKKLLQRAEVKPGLTARFTKNAQNPGKSVWRVFQDGELVLTASVDEISAGRADALHNVIGTKTYGEDLLAKVKAFGAAKTSSLIKSGQAAAPPPPPAGTPNAMPPMDSGAGEASSAPDAGMDAGKDGNVKDKAMEALDKARDGISDATEVVKELLGEKAEMGDLGDMGAPALPEASAPGAAMSPADDASDSSRVSTAALHSMRKELNGALILAFKECIASLQDHEQELSTIVGMYDKGVVNEKTKDLVNSLVNDAITDANVSLANLFKVMDSFVKYAHGTQAMVKRAEEEAEMLRQGNGDHMDLGLMAMIGDTGKEIAEIEAGLAADDAATQTATAANEAVDAMLADDLADDADADDADQEVNDASDAMSSEESSVSCASDMNDADAVKVTTPDGKTVMVPAGSQVVSAELESRAARETLRTKLAADIKWNPVFYDFHPKGGAEPGPLDVKPQDGLEVVENLEEKHDRMLEVATMPPKVRKEAEMIQQLVSEGKLSSKDLDALVANGVDPAAVKYWKEFYGEVGPSGKEFATELVKEHAKAQADEEMNKYRVKLARSYEVAYDMANRGLIPNEKTAIASEVESIMKWNDESFEGMQRVIARHAPLLQKSAGRLPQVGLVSQADVVSEQEGDLVSQLTAAFSTSNKRLF
jgi:hypothetical protein